MVYCMKYSTAEIQINLKAIKNNYFKGIAPYGFGGKSKCCKWPNPSIFSKSNLEKFIGHLNEAKIERY